MGDPYDFGGLQMYMNNLEMSKRINKNSFGISRANLTPWHMVEMAPKEMVDLVIALLQHGGGRWEEMARKEAAAFPSAYRRGRGTHDGQAVDWNGLLFDSWLLIFLPIKSVISTLFEVYNQNPFCLVHFHSVQSVHITHISPVSTPKACVHCTE